MPQTANIGYIYGKRKKEIKRKNVSNHLLNHHSTVSYNYYPAMRGRLHNVKVVTPFSLFPNVNRQTTKYRVAL